MALYALTIFFGAFLLFQVEPIIGKFILPWFGGTPGVWTVCLLFFQTVLVAGYGYAHLLARLAPRRQAAIHVALLVFAVLALPIVPADTWRPQAAGDPTGRILALLAVNLGLPFFVLSATGPLIQAWSTRTHPGRTAYRLYALSNAGSLLALISYPFLVEWLLSRREQARAWAAGLIGFAILAALCAWRLGRGSPAQPASSREPPPASGPSAAGERALWVALPAVASVLLLATTNKLCEDLAVMPFLWVLPLGLYLTSFIVCFERPGWYRRGLFTPLLILAVAAVAGLLFLDEAAVPAPTQLGVYSAALFVGCLFCHGELYRLRPPQRALTGFYLAVAVGGALGGGFVAVLAPRIFDSYLELPLGYWALTALVAVLGFRTRSLALAAGGALGAVLCVPLVAALHAADAHATGSALAAAGRFVADFRWGAILLAAVAAVAFGDRRRGVVRNWRFRSALFPVVLSAAFGAAFCVQVRAARREAASLSRSFFGVLSVFDLRRDEPAERYLLLTHGRIVHGLQFTDRARAVAPTTYYGPSSGVGLAIDSLPWQRPRRIGLVGLGAGTLAAYGRAGDTLRIYEINPQVVQLARTRFTYLARCPARVEIVLGDARRSLEREWADGRPQDYDLLALDAFTSDAIPVHLLTVEAFALYARHLRPDGILAVHVSNRYFDLEPVVARLARQLGLACVAVNDDGADWWVYPTDWVLVAKDPRVLRRPLIRAGADLGGAAPAGRAPLWTDDYASLAGVLK